MKTYPLDNFQSVKSQRNPAFVRQTKDLKSQKNPPEDFTDRRPLQSVRPSAAFSAFISVVKNTVAIPSLVAFILPQSATITRSGMILCSVQKRSVMKTHQIFQAHREWRLWKIKTKVRQDIMQWGVKVLTFDVAR